MITILVRHHLCNIRCLFLVWFASSRAPEPADEDEEEEESFLLPAVADENDVSNIEPKRVPPSASQRKNKNPRVRYRQAAREAS